METRLKSKRERRKFGLPVAPIQKFCWATVAKRSNEFAGGRLLMQLLLLLLLAHPSLAASSYVYVPSHAQPPAPKREFRGVWVASVGNIDWPSQPGLSTQQQKAELIALLDRAVYLRLNAVIFQVRPSCDALYASQIEPWSEYLTGQMGQSPNPPYDPLAFAIDEAHQRGLELHAWFNPYRARTPSARSPISANHVSKLHPDWVKSYGGYLWLDPGNKNVQDYILKIFLDVVKRYDIDAVHIDDYFYPPEEKRGGRVIPFPDWQSWKPYVDSGGRLSRDDWRRANVDNMIERLYSAIKAEKPRVKFGVSPAGIWRPGNPPQIKGFDPYAQIFADSRKWLNNGWLDYFSPQLYWDIDAPAQSYPVLLNWWASQNTMHRHLWPGNSVEKLGKNRSATEIVNQILRTRQQPGATGNLFWDCRPLMENRANIWEALRRDVYTEPALVPISPWLDSVPPAKPKVYTGRDGSGRVCFGLENGGDEDAWLWLLQTKVGADWKVQILPGRVRVTQSFDSREMPRFVAVSAIDRCGNASPPYVLELKEERVSGK